MADNFKGFDLFNDITDASLRTRNRAVILANIAEDHSKAQRITPKGVSLIMGYFKEIPPDERNLVKNAFAVNMNQRGFHLVAA